MIIGAEWLPPPLRVKIKREKYKNRWKQKIIEKEEKCESCNIDQRRKFKEVIDDW